MSLLIVPHNRLTRAVSEGGIKLKDIDLQHIPHSVCANISALDTVIVVNKGWFKLLKDRHGMSQVGRTYPIKRLIFFLYRYNHDIVPIKSKDALNWIYELTRFLDSKQLQELSQAAEKKAFEKT